MTDTKLRPKDARSTIQLLRDLPSILIALAKAELNHAKTELTTRLKAAGIGIAFFVVAALFGWFALNVLIVTAILGLAVALPPWLAALIVAVVLLILAGVFVFIGLRAVKKGVPPVPTNTISSVKDDVDAIKGVGQYDY